MEEHALHRASLLPETRYRGDLANLGLVHVAVDAEMRTILSHRNITDLNALLIQLSDHPGVRDIVLMRHAESVNNATKTVSGVFKEGALRRAYNDPKDSQVLMSRADLEDATKSTRKSLRARQERGERTQFFVSPMRRTIQTFLTIADGTGDDVRLLAQLQERRKTTSDDRVEPENAIETIAQWVGFSETTPPSTEDGLAAPPTAEVKDSNRGGAVNRTDMWERVRTQLRLPDVRRCEKATSLAQATPLSKKETGRCDSLSRQETLPIAQSVTGAFAATELPESVQARARAALHAIVDGTPPGTLAFVVAHGGIIEAMRSAYPPALDEAAAASFALGASRASDADDAWESLARHTRRMAVHEYAPGAGTIDLIDDTRFVVESEEDMCASVGRACDRVYGPRFIDGTYVLRRCATLADRKCEMPKTLREQVTGKTKLVGMNIAGLRGDLAMTRTGPPDAKPPATAPILQSVSLKDKHTVTLTATWGAASGVAPSVTWERTDPAHRYVVLPARVAGRAPLAGIPVADGATVTCVQKADAAFRREVAQQLMNNLHLESPELRELQRSFQQEFVDARSCDDAYIKTRLPAQTRIAELTQKRTGPPHILFCSEYDAINTFYHRFDQSRMASREADIFVCEKCKKSFLIRRPELYVNWQKVVSKRAHRMGKYQPVNPATSSQPPPSSPSSQPPPASQPGLGYARGTGPLAAFTRA